MPLTNDDYNGFARGLAKRVIERAKGLDEESRRLVKGRPPDYVLAGFLTPGGVPAEEQGDQEQPASGNGSREGSAGADGPAEERLNELLAQDLPQDGAYEQTNIGMEWKATLNSLTSGSTLSVDVEMAVYVRRLPGFEEQRRHATWRVPRRRGVRAASSNAPGSGSEEARESELVAVWTREFLPRKRVEIDLGELREKRRLAVDISDHVRAEGWENVNRAELYPGRRAIRVREADMVNQEAYERRLASYTAAPVAFPWRPVVDVRLVAAPTEPGCVRIALRLMNRSPRPRREQIDFVDPNLYAVRVVATAPSAAHADTVFQELPDSYRYDRRMPGVGINAHVSLARPSPSLVTLEADSVPTKEVPRLEPRSVEGAAPRFDALASDPVPVLRRVLEEMQSYESERWQEKIDAPSGVELEEAERDRERFRAEMRRFEVGVRLLEDERYPHVRRAFALMNEAMGRAARGYEEWRLFQVVFVVSQLPGLATREYPEIGAEDEEVDILWFAAGGGKTEAFLGLVVWQAFFDRLRGKKVGTAALVRFPLRLLAFQQLQRLARVLGQAELIRMREGLRGSRFSMGYFVGSTVTPNSVRNLHEQYQRHGPESRNHQVFECPFCGADTRLGYDTELRVVEHRCTADSCPGGRSRLPVYVVDDDVYRFLPTVIVATVDKLAVLGQNRGFHNILGRFDVLCHKHGVSFGTSNRACPAAQALGQGEGTDRCGEAVVERGPFREPAPSLLIQDELHLLNEDLGAFDAHYETGAMQLARSLGARPWKIVAATATIQDYEQHAYQLYLRRARQFPGPGPEAYESFYYQQNPEKLGRIFVGILGVGRKHTPSATRMLSLIYLELQRARELSESDVTEAASRYGTQALNAQEFREMIFYYELPLTYVLTRKGSDQVAEAIESRVRKELEASAPNHGDLIVDTFNGGADVTLMRQAMHHIESADYRGDPSERIRGVVATNIISHGVDVNRFNIMIFAGFTRLVAEYIQASARVGRKYPGISFLVATPQSERDRSIFDRFAKFHEYLDRLVDPSPVNRWSEKLLQRTVPGLLAGYLMGPAAQSLGRSMYSVEDVLARRGVTNSEVLDDEQVVVWMRQALGAEQADSSGRYADQLEIVARNRYASIVNSRPRSGQRPTGLNVHLEAMRSLRDVDDPAWIEVESQQDQDIMRGLCGG